jgi:hypothetical protein
MAPGIALSLAVLLLCAPPALAKGSKCDIMLKRIDILLEIYEKDHPLKHYPSTLKEFQNFAAKKGQPLDLSVFSEFSYERHGTRLGITYTCKDTGKSAAEVRASITVY